jgi:phosphohistidine swiveling domain-containing protein
LLDHRKRVPQVGNKAANLQHLCRLGMRTPITYVLGWEAYDRYCQNDVTIIEAVSGELERKLDLTRCYAVRSSANIEDSRDHSFAGQFKTVLNVQGRDALLQAIWSIWATAQTSAVQEYLGKRGLDDTNLKMAVLLQEMIRPVISGVSFSRNPISGLRETVVEAVCGPGTALVQEGVTPARWIYRNGGFTGQAESGEIPLSLIEEVVDCTRRLARRLKKDVDMEWVYDGEQLYWVQLREITALNEIQVYSNRISREMMAGIIKPLVWSVNIPLVNGAWIRLLTEVIGPNNLEPHKLARAFYYRSYFNMGLLGKVFEEIGFPAESLEMAWGIAPKTSGKFKFRPGPQALRLLPRLAAFVWEKWNLGRRLHRRLPELEAEYRAINLQSISKLSLSELLCGIDHLFRLTQETAYYNIVLPLSMYAYNGVLRGQMKKLGVDYARLDMQTDMPEFQRFNPAVHLDRLNRKFQSLEPAQQELVRRSTFQEVLTLPGLDGLPEGLNDLMDKFGHLCDNGNDFSTVPWRECPDTILRLVTEYHTGTDQSDSHQLTAQKVRLDSLHLPFWNAWMVRRLYRRTRRFNLYREQISYIYTYGYGLFRVYFLALGQYFVCQGLLESPEDIFYLDWEEIRQVVEAKSGGLDPRKRVEEHKRKIEQVRHVQLPTIIYGDQPPPVEVASGHVLTGTPTSRGYCSGPVRVVTGLGDFQKVQAGDILVIPYSDVGWTPLFARAAGVIAESGGMLSHSSIVAREYGIPAIVSVTNATLLPDGIHVSMDGYKGEIVVHEEEKGACSEC